MRKPIVVLFLFSLSVFCVPHQAHADAAEQVIRVEASVDKAFVTVGEVIKYRVTISALKDVEILSSVPAPSHTILEIKKVKDISERDGKYRVTGREFDLTAFRLGEFIIDPVEISYRFKSGEVKKATSKKIFITVKSVTDGEEMSDIRDVKNVVELPYKIAKFIPYILGAVFLLALFIIYILFFAKKPEDIKPKPITPLTAKQKALQALHELFDSSLLREGRVKTYYFKFSEIIKTYLEDRHQIPAVEQTTSEIIRSLRTTTVSTHYKEALREVLDFADLAKYAKWVPKPSDITVINKKIERLIQEEIGAAEPKLDADESQEESTHGV